MDILTELLEQSSRSRCIILRAFIVEMKRKYTKRGMVISTHVQGWLDEADELSVRGNCTDAAEMYQVAADVMQRELA